MLLGIDVGGTFTDAVVVGNGQVTAWAKTPTTQGNLIEGILKAMDEVLVNVDRPTIERVSLSTTIVTNALVEGKADRVGLLLMPGPGMDLTGLFPVNPCFISGYVDHRGREIAAPREAEIDEVRQQLAGAQGVAIAGKFSVRNPEPEKQVAAWVRSRLGIERITLSSAVSGSLNFVRRANSAYYNSAVGSHFGRFAAAIEEAVRQRGIEAPVFILKADGGTMPLSAARSQPVEAVFTGPAASVLGIMALQRPAGDVVSLDIGGTTTDLALWRNGIPLFAQRGARIEGYPTAVRSFRLKSVGIGGDSYAHWENGRLKIGPVRRGPAMAAGGPEPALSDALIVAGLSRFGDPGLAEQAMRRLGEAGGFSPQETAVRVIETAACFLQAEIDDMVAEHAAEPVYKVEDIVHEAAFCPLNLIGVGGAAAGLVPCVAEKMKLGCILPAGAMVANAIGAAVARPTVEVTLRADSDRGIYSIAECGVVDRLPDKRMNMTQVRQLGLRHLTDRAAREGIVFADAEAVYEEEFNLVRGFNTVGKSFTCRLQVKPGVLLELRQGVE
ncbi:hydantoinase/oxoprolinase [Lucifera butyrica]|uniref:Hydantoinase/oxoprolinase n=1 Tax=Lucifera butyrica TaxID=1351585 RepID=A0A498R5S8_9FIRM|nr:hydantoinase/oxoprolinase family protein [Lucifera butyrica]VBB06509.1 hydantoinase/oxoprolinase [Lucifera butyrica]